MSQVTASLVLLMRANFKQVVADLKTVRNQFNVVGYQVDRMGQSLTRNLTLPLGSAVAGAVKAASDFESAFAGVQKTVEATPKQFDRIAKSIKQLSTELPFSTTEISAVAEAAGQLGIKQKDIMSFSQTMLELGKATNLSSEEAAISLARFMNVTGIAQSESRKLGDSIVYLGNNFAASEQEITEMAQRMASVTQVAPISAQEVLGFAAAATAAGIKAEMAGTAMRKLAKTVFGAAVEGGEKLSKMAEIAARSSDVTVEQFQRIAQSTPTKAIQMLLRSINQMDKESGEAKQAIEDLGIQEARLEEFTLLLSGSIDTLDDALEKAKFGFESSNALSKETAVRFETFASKVKVLWNNITVLAQEFGATLLPVLENVISFVQGAVQSFQGLSENTRFFIVTAAALTAALGPLLIAFGAIAFSISNIAGIIPLAVLVTTKLGVAFGALSSIAATLLPAFGGLSLTFSGLISFAGMLIAKFLIFPGVIAAVVASFLGFGDEVSAIVRSITDYLGGIGEVIVDAFTIAMQAVSMLVLDGINALAEYFGLWSSDTSKVIKKTTVNWLGYFGSFVKSAGSVFSELLVFLPKIFNELSKIIQTWAGKAIGYITDTFAGAFEYIRVGLEGMGLVKSADAFKKPIKEIIPPLKEVQSELAKTGAAAKDLGDSVDTAMSKTTGAISDATEGTKTYTNTTTDAEEKLKRAAKEREKAEREKEEAAKKAAAEEKKRLRENEKLRRQAIKDTREMTREVSTLVEGVGSAFGLDRGLTKQLGQLGGLIGGLFGAGKSAQQTKMEGLLDRISDIASPFDIFGSFGGSSNSSSSGISGIFGSLFGSSGTSGSGGGLGSILGGSGGGLGSLLGAGGGQLGIVNTIAQAFDGIGDGAEENGQAFGTAAGAALGSIVPGLGTALGAQAGSILGSLAGGLFGSSKGPGELAREAGKDYFNTLFEDKGGLSFFNPQTGRGDSLTSFDFSVLERFSGDASAGFDAATFASEAREMFGADVAGAFSQVGESISDSLNLEETLGDAGAIGSLIGAQLAEDLGGSFIALEQLLNKMGTSVEDLTQKQIEAGKAGKKSWFEVEVALQDLGKITSEGIQGATNFTQAFENLQIAGQSGTVPLEALKKLASTFLDEGINDINRARQALEATGQFTSGELTTIFQAFQQRGISTMDQLANAGERTLGGIIADSIVLGNTMQGAVIPAERMRDVLNGVITLADAIPETIETQVNITGQISDTVNNAISNIAPTPFAKGGIVTKPTIGLVGEAGYPEAILPLQRMGGGKLGVMANLGGSSNQGSKVTTIAPRVDIAIDARGAQQGSEIAIQRALNAMQDSIVNQTIGEIVDQMERGAFRDLLDR